MLFPILYNGPPLPPPQNCLFLWEIWTPVYTVDGPLGPSESTTQTASQLVEPFLAGLTTVMDRPTDHATWSVTLRPHLRT